jgi:hypothetical protein
MKAYVRVTDLSTGEIEKGACFTNSDTRAKRIKRRVITRAANLYDNAVKMGVKGAQYAFYLQYSWRLELGKTAAIPV